MQGKASGDQLAHRYELTTKRAASEGRELWLARDTTLDREVTALVFAADHPHADATLDGARRAAGVEDHHLPRVLDVGTDDDTSYVISEALGGSESVASMLQFDTLPPEEARRLIGESASGLNTAASRGLHHLMITPHDILRGRDGSVFVTGVATDAALSGLDDNAPDASRVDTVALVQTLYAAITGQWPGDREVPGIPQAKRRVDGMLAKPSELVSGVPNDLDTLCQSTLNEDAGPHTPGELARNLSPWSSERVHGAGGRTGGATRLGVATTPRQPLTDNSQNDDRTDPGTPPRTAPARAAAALPAVAPRRATPDEADATMIGRRPEFDYDDTSQFDPAAFAEAHESGTAHGHSQRERYEPAYDELEPPAPGMAHGLEPDKKSIRLALSIVAGLIVLAIIIAVIGLNGLFKSPNSAADPKVSSSSTAAKSSKPSGSVTPKQPAGQPLAVSSITSFDPEGDGNEHNDAADKAIDNSQTSYWFTHIYGSANFGGTKQGAGLILDLGSSKQVGTVKINILGAPSTLQVYVTDDKTITGKTPFGAINNGSGIQTVTGSGAATGRYVIVWVTQLSAFSGSTYRERISDISVLS